MDYCLFENTLPELNRCHDFLIDSPDDISDEERRYAKRLVAVCADIVRNLGGKASIDVDQIFPDEDEFEDDDYEDEDEDEDEE